MSLSSHQTCWEEVWWLRSCSCRTEEEQEVWTRWEDQVRPTEASENVRPACPLCCDEVLCWGMRWILDLCPVCVHGRPAAVAEEIYQFVFGGVASGLF